MISQEAYASRDFAAATEASLKTGMFSWHHPSIQQSDMVVAAEEWYSEALETNQDAVPWSIGASCKSG